MAAIVFLEIIKPSVRADEILKLLPYRGPASYGQPTGTGRIEVYFNAATVDDEAARAALERALDESGEDAREYLRVIYPAGSADADDGGEPISSPPTSVSREVDTYRVPPGC